MRRRREIYFEFECVQGTQDVTLFHRGPSSAGCCLGRRRCCQRGFLGTPAVSVQPYCIRPFEGGVQGIHWLKSSSCNSAVRSGMTTAASPGAKTARCLRIFLPLLFLFCGLKSWRKSCVRTRCVFHTTPRWQDLVHRVERKRVDSIMGLVSKLIPLNLKVSIVTAVRSENN